MEETKNEYTNKVLDYNNNFSFDKLGNVPMGTVKIVFDFPEKSTMGRIIAFDEKEKLLALIKASSKEEILAIYKEYKELTKQ